MTNLNSYIYEQPKSQDHMPDLVTTKPPVSFYEFWPTWVFYFPMKVYAGWLAIKHGGLTLPTITNPLFDVGGFVCESKSQILDQIPESLSDYTCAHIMFEKTSDNEQAIQDTVNDALELMADKNIAYPCIIKPNVGERGMGVQIVFKDDEIIEYIKNYPLNEKIIIQSMADYPCEAGLFYIRKPDEEKGHIFSLTLKYFPFVTGDGKSTLKELILADRRAGILSHIYLPRHKKNWDMILPKDKRYRIAFTGSHSRGTIFRDGADFITPKMEENWDKLCKEIPEFYFGRFDIRFHTLEDLENLKDVKIIEINGASAEATHIWDSETPILKAYSTLMKQYDYMFAIGKANKKRGYKPMSIKKLWGLIKKHDEITELYPHTH